MGWAVVVATGWSRVQLRDHTAAQVIAGGLLGGLIAAAAFIPLS
jgi:membrane-associated phospholipid phosphatase